MSDTYEYVALDGRGGRHTGVLIAQGVDEVADQVRRMGLRPVDVREQKNSALKAELHIPLLNKIGQKKRARNELAVFSRQLSTMIAAGLPLMRCLSTLALQTENAALVTTLQVVMSEVASGDRLSSALAKHPDWFDAFYVSMVQAGEASGDLDKVLEQLADTVEKSADLRRKIRSAMTYPVAIGSLASLIVLCMLLFLVPTMKHIFDGLNGQLPLPTRVVIAVSDPLVSLIPFAGKAAAATRLLRATMLFGTIVLVRRSWKKWKSTEAGRLKLDTFKLRIPVFGDIISRTSLARFARSMAVLTRSGIPILDALHIAQATVGNEVVANALTATAHEVKGGQAFGASLGEHDVFPPMIVQMVSVGEETGEVDHMLEKVAQFYESEISAKVDALTSLLEPIMLVVMGVMIGGMLVSLYLPMFRVISLIK